VSLERIADFEYLNHVIQEALRFMPPAVVSSQYIVKEDFKAGGKVFPKGAQFLYFFPGLHNNSKQWQRPEEFLPDRFNPESPLFLTPDGKKRHPFAWLPFSCGQRVCFGKTFAEGNLKYILTYLAQYFDF